MKVGDLVIIKEKPFENEKAKVTGINGDQISVDFKRFTSWGKDLSFNTKVVIKY